ncbi:MAG: hypothetical protein AAGA92_09870 [Planctomycetota bacterium]
MWVRLLNVASAVSLVAFLVLAALWARSLCHSEKIHIRSVTWPETNEVRTRFVGLSWYSNTLRLRMHYWPLTAEYFKKYGSLQRTRETFGYREGWTFTFLGEDNTRFMAPDPPGFSAKSWSKGDGDYNYVIAVRPWLPTLLAFILPVVWYVRYRKANYALSIWQFSLRELILTLTTASVFLALAS